MIYPLIILALSVLVIWVPRTWLRIGRRVARKNSTGASAALANGGPQEMGSSLRLREEITKPRNLVDFFRAACGSVGVVTSVDALMQTKAGLADAEAIRLVVVSIFLLALLLQTLRLDQHRFRVFAPVFYLQGLCVGAVGWKTAALAMLLIWAMSPVISGPAIFLSFYAFLVLGLGLLLEFQFGKFDTLLMTTYVMIPVVLSLLMKRRLSTGFGKRTRVQGARSVREI